MFANKILPCLVGSLIGITCSVAAGAASVAPYPVMAPLDQYMMQQADEIALARSAAPASISDQADVMVLTGHGYVTAVNGSNGFLCLVERSWANETSSPEFWNPAVRSPNCFNQAATASFAQIYLLKTRLVLQGKSKQEILQASLKALDNHEIPALIPGAMCYMMSKQQYLNDQDKNWHPHVMFFVAGDVAKSWGAELPGSSLMAATDHEERVTIFMMWAPRWSDGTPAPGMNH